jgi:hypothetical protein
MNPPRNGDESGFTLPREIERFVAALSHVYKNKKQELPQKLVANAIITIEENSFDNWDGGQTGFLLHLQVPDVLFAEVLEAKDEYEKEMKRTLNKLVNIPHEFIDSVSIEMRLVEDEEWREKSGLLLQPQRHVSQRTQERIWTPGCLRAFLSHKAKHKAHASALKEYLDRYGVSCFVAHKDIQPTKEWVQEIESALFSMDFLGALLTDDFHNSDWTDQEIGVALGRQVPIIPVKLGKDPYGFIGKYQALSGSWDDIPKMASDIFGVVVHDPAILAKMKRWTVDALKASPSFERSKFIVQNVLHRLGKLENPYPAEIIAAFNENSQVSDCFTARGSLPSLLREWTGNQYCIEDDKIVESTAPRGLRRAN